MPDSPTEISKARPAEQPAGDTDLHETDEMVEEELLIEDVSIDGMCGVY